jgi:predicted ATP-binding protein involved in virulence
VILFLGTSPEGVEYFFSSLGPNAKSAGPHFALVPASPQLQLYSERLTSSYGVHLLAYSASPDHPQIAEFVQKCLAHVQMPPRRRTRPLVDAPKLRHLHLRDIGPFSELDLDLSGLCTVLLGDNASGKSTVLRAIAVVLAGDAPFAEYAAKDLLRVDAGEGSITMNLERGELTTRLARDSTGVHLTSAQVTPVQARLWLALGFPSLRGAGGEDPPGPQRLAALPPHAGDLEPLISNLVDGRLRSLKQWLVNAAVRAEQEGRSRAANQTMLNVLFGIVGELMPDLSPQYAGLDRNTWQVFVRLNGGTPVPLDLLSRGMTSILGWVGVLLERLYQVHGDELRDPGKCAGLLLIDELDVHLHPEWQRLVLPVFRSRFPNIQIVITTHSPLVVGSLPDARLIHLMRSGAEVTSTVLDQSFIGWRSDQILTSAAFDLDTSRDLETGSMLRSYRELLSSGSKGRAGANKADELSRRLNEVMPRTQERQVDRDAAKLVREYLQQRLVDLPDDAKQSVIEAAEVYMARLDQGH